METKDNQPLVRIVDDEETIRKSEEFILKIAGIDSVSYSSAEDFLSRADLERPGCIVADLRMDGMDGLEMMDEMKRRGFDLPIVFLTGHGTVEAAVFALKGGACDFLQKPVKPEILQEIVRKLIQKNIDDRRLSQYREQKKERYQELTEREKQIFELVAQDKMNKQIAMELGIAEHTVKIHRANALRKLGIRTAIEAHNFLKELSYSC
ncbi:response regulator transcription factor [Parasutterella muris]|uniref:Response regulator n=1 Tax=Parasutterella muris TaxID=2565572 RepID=A0A6L6YL23_9BURK|nr:response regulator [Parasutterella muris]MVX57469.1 response regulator [Parasutterella muris]